MKEKINLGFAFTKQNYIMLIIGVLFICAGLLIMIGGGSDNPELFSKKIAGYGDYELFNAQRLIVAPILIAMGFIIEVFAIMYKPK